MIIPTSRFFGRLSAPAELLPTALVVRGGQWQIAVGDVQRWFALDAGAAFEVEVESSYRGDEGAHRVRLLAGGEPSSDWHVEGCYQALRPDWWELLVPEDEGPS